MSLSSSTRASAKKVKTGLLRSKLTTPLHAAVELNDPDMVGLLVARGADIRAANGKHDCVDFLLGAGADLHKTD